MKALRRSRRGIICLRTAYHGVTGPSRTAQDGFQLSIIFLI